MFNTVKNLLQENITKVLQSQSHIFLTNVDKDEMWNTYINSFSEASGLRQENNCNACKSFIRHYGNMVVIVEGKTTSIWNFKAEDETYQTMLDNMDKLVLSKPIHDVFVTDQSNLGTNKNNQLLDDLGVITWEHLFYKLPNQFVTKSRDTLDTIRGAFRTQQQVFKRSLEELSIGAVETVIELINQNSLYRGEEFKGILVEFLRIAKEYSKLKSKEKDNYTWANSVKVGPTISKIKNTAIGTLLVDISGGMELDEAVGRFEKIMAPSNYKRPTPVVTKRMIEDAEKTIESLGLQYSLGRKLACPEDLNVNNFYFVNRTPKAKAGGIFGDLKEEMLVNPRTLSKVEEISIDDFITKVVPTASSIELLFENRHGSNLFSLIAPINNEAPSLFKWPNAFSWSYRNALADSMREKVKAAGGKVEGLLRVSLEWFNYNDLDLHLIEPNKHEIYYGDRISRTGGHLDVDMNIMPDTRTPVENIIYANDSNILEGKYQVKVHCFSYRENLGPSLSVEIEHNGEVFQFSPETQPSHKQTANICEFEYHKTKGLRFLGDVKSSVSSQNMWGLDTNKFHNVSMILPSPNYWGDSKVGNKHIFFVLDGAHNNDSNIRGIFNEFLDPELERAHKRVFEALANKSKVEANENPKQISGLGFSTTMDNSFVCKVTGAFNRTLKVKI